MCSNIYIYVRDFGAVQLPTRCGCWRTEWLKGSRPSCAQTCHPSSSNSWGRCACWWTDKVIVM